VARMSHVNGDLWAVVEEKISPQRLASYLREANGDQDRAVCLYEWNNNLSASLWQLLSILEVGVRNSIDSKMRERQLRLHRKEHWIFDDYLELGRQRTGSGNSNQPYRDIESAIARVQKNGKPLTPSQIISETSFGFWNQLVGKRNKFLWPDLAGAFPNAPTRDQKYVSTLFSDLRDIRNRISHNHKLHPKSVEAGELMILELAKAINPDFAEWLQSMSRIAEVKDSRP